MKVDQLKEMPVTSENEQFAWRYAYSRAQETRKMREKGQDYLTFARNQRSFLFSLCDGVSLSYYGDIAARILGDALLDWLSSEIAELEDDSLRLQKHLDHHLRDLTKPASQLVAKHPIPTNVTGMLRDVLEAKRQRGSETTFVCGRIDLPSTRYPSGRIIVAWQGDSRLRLFDAGQEVSSCLPGVFHTSERWSTLHGPVGGEPHLFVGTLRDNQRITRLIAYTDGLAELDEWGRLPSDGQLQSLINQAGEKPASDDIALLEVSWNPEGFVNRALDREERLQAQSGIRGKINSIVRRLV